VPFFVVAYLFFGSLMLGTGSIGSTQREVQQWAMIWSLLAAVPMVFLVVLLHEPHGLLARVLTFVPFSAPIVAIFRLAIDPQNTAWWEIAGSFLVLALSTWLAVRMGARMFRVGILLTGARPRLKEILRQARLGR
jgi:ABC-2 type transport system permease protein